MSEDKLTKINFTLVKIVETLEKLTKLNELQSKILNAQYTFLVKSRGNLTPKAKENHYTETIITHENKDYKIKGNCKFNCGCQVSWSHIPFNHTTKKPERGPFHFKNGKFVEKCPTLIEKQKKIAEMAYVPEVFDIE